MRDSLANRAASGKKASAMTLPETDPAASFDPHFMEADPHGVA
jgi:hypothetical protein